MSTLDALRALEEIEASVKALRSLIADVNSYTKYAFWQSCEPYFMNIAEDLERSWDWLEQKMETMRE